MTDEEENKCLTGYKKLFCANCEADCTTSILDCNGYQLFFKGYEQGYEDCNTCHSSCKNENAEMKEQLTKAKELIEELSSSLSVVGECGEEECELLNRAEQFIREVEE